MTDVLKLVRPEIRKLWPYQPAEWITDSIRLSANETPWQPPGDASSPGLNRYPEPRPTHLTAVLANHYGIPDEQLVVTRGSSEAVDLLLRCFCRPGQDEIIVCPPTFSMYAVYARIQGATVHEVPLSASKEFAIDHDGIAEAWNERSKLLFICSPNNPTGHRVPNDELHALCDRIGDSGIVVVDGAYTEFADADPTLELLDQHGNVVVLRTLSKAFGLAGIRCGSLLGPADLVEIMNRVLPPFCFPTPCQDAAMACLTGDYRTVFGQRIDMLKKEREKLAARLLSLPDVEHVWPSEANFLLVKVANTREFTAQAFAGGVSIRDFSWDPHVKSCVRITIGNEEQNAQLMQALTQPENQ